METPPPGMFVRPLQRNTKKKSVTPTTVSCVALDCLLCRTWLAAVSWDSMSRLRLWGHARFRAGRVLWMLEELGLDYEHRPLWSRTADMEAPDFVAASPRRKIPVIQDGDFTLTESAAINTYLCDTYAPDSGWVPPPCTRDRAIYDAWLMTIMTELDAQSLYIHRKHQCLSEVYGAAPVVVDAARDYFLRQLESVTAVLQASPSLLAGAHTFTAADLLLTHCLCWAREIDWLPDDPVLRAYLDRNTARPAFQRYIAKAREDPHASGPRPSA